MGDSGDGSMTQSDVMIEASNQQNVDTVVISSVFDKLTDELLIETLIRLPLKPVNLCKCISVRFRSLISTSYFVRCYLNHHKIKTTFALYYRSDPGNRICMAFGSPNFESPGFSLSFLPRPEHETIQYLASNNGLVLCSAAGSRRVVYFVCNPLTKQWIALPPTRTYIKNPYIGIICNPQYLCNVNDDHEQPRVTSFKVVRIQSVKSKSVTDSLRLEIFCSESGRWSNEYYRPSSTSYRELFYRHNYWCHSVVVCGGLLHWNNLSKHGIFTYDPYNAKCGTIGYPPGIIESSFHCCLGESAGSLRYANFSTYRKTYQVWELKECSNGGDQWFLLHKVHFNEMESPVQRIGFIGLLPPHPLNQDIVFFWCRVSQRILEYNMRTKLLIKLPCFLQDAWNTRHSFPTFFPFVLPCWPTTIPPIEQYGQS